MRHATLATRLALAALLAVSAAGCALPPPGEGVVWVRLGPPPPRREVIIETERPGPEFVWVTGYYRWDGVVYAWVPGHWDRPPRPRAVWVTGRWYHERRGWYWVEGHWRY